MFEIIRKILFIKEVKIPRLQKYPPFFEMDRLTIGVDNIRIDVHLSPDFRNAVRALIALTMEQLAGVEVNKEPSDRKGLMKAIDAFKHCYKNLSKETINTANTQNEVQIDSLVFTSVVKLVIVFCRQEYVRVINLLKATIRDLDLSNSQEFSIKSANLKDKLSELSKKRENLLAKAGMTVFSHMMELNQSQLKDLRMSILGDSIVLFDDILTNPIIHTDNPFNDESIVETYEILFGRRIEDQDRYSRILYLIKSVLKMVSPSTFRDESEEFNRRSSTPTIQKTPESTTADRNTLSLIENYLCKEKNIDILLNYFETIDERKKAKKRKENASKIRELSERIKIQRKILHFFYRHFSNTGLMQNITAFYLIFPIHRAYCPPLAIQQLQHYLIEDKGRKKIKKQIKQIKKIYGTSLDLKPLNHRAHQMEDVSIKKKQIDIVRYLKSFSRFHRDYVIYRKMRESMDRVNLITDEKMLTLSRENYTLYEILLPHEKLFIQKKIINHSVIKADVRGSTDITKKMNERNLNPATFFSLNFFNPISDVLYEYNASKVFIEGDALILSVFEYDNMSSDNFAVARSCGLAMNIIQIIEFYNEKSRQHNLPVLELGIGICFADNPPTFLFDGNHRIMISDAINKADRLSSSSKLFKEQPERINPLYNLLVLKPHSEKPMDDTKDKSYIRYNINGIELNKEGFEKLSEEIKLMRISIDLPDWKETKDSFFTGKYPTRSGNLRRIIIRKSMIPIIYPPSLKPVGFSKIPYYEVVTNEHIFEAAAESLKRDTKDPHL